MSSDKALRLGTSLLMAYGASEEHARIVAEHLVESDLAGVPSHGLVRVPQYVKEILTGAMDPRAIPTVSTVTPAGSLIEGHRCFGQVAARRALDVVKSAAREYGMATVTVRNAGHAGRIGAYAERLSRSDLISLIFCSGPPSGHRVAPFGARDGRLATNPIAFAIPTTRDPIVGDFSTATMPEGRIRLMHNLGIPLPPDAVLDAIGVPTSDPDVLYRDPPGTILPLGGHRLGHRGFALGLLVEAMATLLSGEEAADDSRVGNNLAIVVFSTDSGFGERADRMATYLRSARPIDTLRPVLLPGEPEQAARSSATEVAIDLTTWAEMRALALERDVQVEEIS